MSDALSTKSWHMPDTEVLDARIRRYVKKQSLDPDKAALMFNGIYGALQTAKSAVEVQRQRMATDQRKAQTIARRLLRRGKEFYPVLEAWEKIYPQAQEVRLRVLQVLTAAENIVRYHDDIGDRRGKSPRVEVQIVVPALAGVYLLVFGQPPTVEGDRDKNNKSKFQLFVADIFALADYTDNIPHSTLGDALMSWRKLNGVRSKKSVKKPRAKMTKFVGSFG